MALGADDYLAKPFGQAELLSAIAGRLARFQHLKPNYDLQAGGGLCAFTGRCPGRGQARKPVAGPQSPRHSQEDRTSTLEGEEATQVYFVKSGRVKTMRTTAGGKELITAIYGSGEFFGYPPLLQRTPRTDLALAVDDTEVVYTPQDDFTLLRNAEADQRFMTDGWPGERAGRSAAGHGYNPIRRRVTDAPLHLHEQAGPAPDAGTQRARDDLVALVGTAHESLVRTLNVFKASGLIELAPRTIRALNPDKLRKAPW